MLAAAGVTRSVTVGDLLGSDEPADVIRLLRTVDRWADAHQVALVGTARTPRLLAHYVRLGYVAVGDTAHVYRLPAGSRVLVDRR